MKKLAIKALALPTFLELPSLAPPMKIEDAAEIDRLAEPGDIILSTEKSVPFYSALAKAALDSDFGHASLYVGHGRVIEAGPSGVKERKLFSNGSHFTLLKPHYKNETDRWKAVDYAYKSVGKPYDWLSENNGEALTCTDLIMNAMAQGDTEVRVEEKQFMGHRLVTPNAFYTSPDIDVAVEVKSPWYKNVAGALPAIGITAAGGVAGHMIGGWPGAVIGTVAGYVGGTVALSIIDGAIHPDLQDRPWDAQGAQAVEGPKVNASPNPVTVVETSCQSPGQSIELEGDCTVEAPALRAAGGELDGWKLAKTPSS